MRQKSDGVTEIFRCHPHLGLKDNKENFVFNASRDWKPMEMFFDVRRYMEVTGMIMITTTTMMMMMMMMMTTTKTTTTTTTTTMMMIKMTITAS